MRNVPLLTEHYNRFNEVPQYMAIGFAAYLLFMKAEKEVDGKYYGIRNIDEYFIQDDWAAFYYNVWKTNDANTLTNVALSNTEIWGMDLTAFKGFANAVTNYLKLFMENKFLEVIKNIKSLEVKI